MTIDLDLAAIENFAIAIVIGALVGIEREKRRDTETTIGGIRTFAARLLASLGGMPGEWQPVGNLTPMNGSSEPDRYGDITCMRNPA